jgi:predicted DNA binding protein
MWTAKFKVWHKDCEIRPLCQKHKVTDFVYVVKNWEEGERFFYLQYHILQGTQEAKKAFVKEFKKLAGVKKAEFKGNCLLTLREEPQLQSFSPIFDPEVIQVKPVIQRTDGYEDWELASWKKEKLMKILEIPLYKATLTSVKQSKLSDVVLPHLGPNLTDKQKEVIQLAMKHGYFEFPRKIDLVGLAKLAKVSRPAFQERLRKAEKKIIPLFTESAE